MDASTRMGRELGIGVPQFAAIAVRVPGDSRALCSTEAVLAWTDRGLTSNRREIVLALCVGGSSVVAHQMEDWTMKTLQDALLDVQYDAREAYDHANVAYFLASYNERAALHRAEQVLEYWDRNQKDIEALREVVKATKAKLG